MKVLLFSLLALFVGVLILRDANRLAMHVKIAEKMMDSGISEIEAMELSGCNFWDTPWHRRLFKPYPKI